MTPEQIADQATKRQRDGRILGSDRRRAAELEAVAAISATPHQPRTTSWKAAAILNLGPALPYAQLHGAEAAARAHLLDEIAGHANMPDRARVSLDVMARRAAGRLVLGEPGGLDSLWTVRDGRQTVTAWIQWKHGPTLRARATRGKAKGHVRWPLYIALILWTARGKVTRCRACRRWYGRTHGRQWYCSPACRDS
jgi:hypothetical protein